MIKVKVLGSFSKLEDFLNRSRKKTRMQNKATEIAEACIEELKKVTPKDTGKTAESWDYEIKISGKKTSIIFVNNNLQNGINVALLLEYGHGTSTGGWVEGQEYIDPVIQKNYLKAINTTWKEMSRL